MSDVAIRVEGLSKQYHIGEKRRPYKTFRESLGRTLTWPYRTVSLIGRRFNNSQANAHNDLRSTFWALKDISFEIKQGDVVGIIGRNGAGKSTLLKILSRITEPTAGYADINGRVASLLEVGTGFHPELTGRENILLNGTILGMKRNEIQRNFDEIVSFAEVEQFIDTPVKHYSSGMYLRLAFAVAAHLEPEILIVDEVLAVGDAAFQKKCLGKMSAVAKQGRTVLFVSHNMTAVSNLCDNAFLLEEGKIASAGDTFSVIRKYLNEGQVRDKQDLREHPGRLPKFKSLMRSISLKSNGISSAQIKTNGPFEIEADCEVDTNLSGQLSMGFLVKDSNEMNIFASNMHQYGLICSNVSGQAKFKASIKQLPLSPGSYTISLYLGNGSYDLDVIEKAISFDVLWEPRIDILCPPNPHWGPTFVSVDWSFN